MRKQGLVCVLFAVFLVTGSAPIAAPDQSYPGQPTQGRVWIENRGPGQAIPVTVHEIASGAIVKTQLVGTPAVAISAPAVFDTRQTRQTWEYQRVQLPSDDDPTAELNRLGKDGWETVLQYTTGRGGLVVVFKRPR